MIGAYRRFATIAAGAVALVAISAGTSAAAGSPQATVQGLVGNWTCVSHSSDNATFQESDVDTMYGKWLKIVSTYAAQMGAPAGTGTAFFGYDARNRRWIVTGAGTSGDYYVNYSNSPDFDGAKWHDGYPDRHGTAVMHLTAFTRYTIDSVGPNPQGKDVTAHEVCVRH
jgi:hypothetical protein